MFVGQASPTPVVMWDLVCYVENNYAEDITDVTITFLLNGVTVIAEQNVGSVAPGNNPFNLGTYQSELNVTCVVDWTDPDSNPHVDDPASNIGDYNFQLVVGP